MDNKWKISLASPPDRKKLVAMIDFSNEQWAELNFEQSDDRLQLEIYPKKSGGNWLFELNDVAEVLSEAKKRLLQQH